jgi:hypothetical protein
MIRYDVALNVVAFFVIVANVTWIVPLVVPSRPPRPLRPGRRWFDEGMAGSVRFS